MSQDPRLQQQLLWTKRIRRGWEKFLQIVSRTSLLARQSRHEISSDIGVCLCINKTPYLVLRSSHLCFSKCVDLYKRSAGSRAELSKIPSCGVQDEVSYRYHSVRCDTRCCHSRELQLASASLLHHLLTIITQPGIPSASSAKSLLGRLTVATLTDDGSYDRALFPHWEPVPSETQCSARLVFLKLN